MFFVLSEYLITALLLRERSRTGTITLRSFYMRRVLRLYPAPDRHGAGEARAPCRNGFYVSPGKTAEYQAGAGSDTSASAAVTTETFVSGTAKQISATTDVELTCTRTPLSRSTCRAEQQLPARDL